ncbi:MAG: amino acid ABC transporter ATP-binding protein [Lachnospiraceae bacterium]|nr:amino acid ABC transporter ATP-binding protein [Lachnospiraceae bacterium]
MSDVLFEMNHIRKSFDGTEVLKDISLCVNKGEVISIIGPSGSGKSTLLRCATLLENIDGGDMSYMGETVCRDEKGKSVYTSQNELKKIHNYFGLVFQNFNLFPHYSVMKNIVDAPVHVQKVPLKDAEKRARDLLEQFGLADKENAYPCQLSGGQQQRVSIARALALDPQILFFDEPTSALDPELTKDVLNVIKQLASEHMTMIIVTHEMNFARKVSDRVLFMEHGYIQRQGTPEEVLDSDDDRIREFVGKLTDTE